MSKFKKSYPDKWQDGWFLNLNHIQKLIYFYLIDQCDDGGFFEPDYALMAFVLKLKEEVVQQALSEMEPKIEFSIDRKILWVRSYIRWQANGPVIHGKTKLDEKCSYTRGPVIRAIQSRRGQFNTASFLDVLEQADLIIADKTAKSWPQNRADHPKPKPKPKPKPAGTPEPKGNWRPVAKELWPIFKDETNWDDMKEDARQELLAFAKKRHEEKKALEANANPAPEEETDKSADQ